MGGEKILNYECKMTSEQDALSSLRNQYGEEFQPEQYQAVVRVLDQRYGLSESMIRETRLEQGPERCVEIHTDKDDSPVYADPDGKYGVSTGIKGDEVPPEGQAVDGNGDVNYGIR